MAGSKKFAFSVVGAGYGDEGKGLLTDWLAAKGASCVVRANGGAQAGHTVVDPFGRRHVFKHFGAGTLSDVPTHLGQRFVLHPMLFPGERDALVGLGAYVKVTADPRAAVTTPWDVMINQFMERRRGDARHGSCGVGFGEAVERSLRDDLRITFSDVRSGRDIRPVLLRIRSEWVPARLAALGGGDLTADETALVASDDVLERFLVDCVYLAEHVGEKHDRDVEDGSVFEGAQGLMLDQDYGTFPHVTRSNTGIRNVMEIAREAGIEAMSVVYVTRCYVTRHGAGPLAHEGDDMSWIALDDPTNQPNEWQGRLRLAPLDFDVLMGAIRHDMGYASDGVEVRTQLAMTCLDQVVGRAHVYHEGRRVDLAGGDDLPVVAAKVSGLGRPLTFSSPVRA